MTLCTIFIVVCICVLRWILSFRSKLLKGDWFGGIYPKEVLNDIPVVPWCRFDMTRTTLRLLQLDVYVRIYQFRRSSRDASAWFVRYDGITFETPVCQAIEKVRHRPMSHVRRVHVWPRNVRLCVLIRCKPTRYPQTQASVSICIGAEWNMCCVLCLVLCSRCFSFKGYLVD